MTGGKLEYSALGEYGTEVGSSGEISGGELEGAAQGESGTEVGSSGDILGGNVDGKLEWYPLRESLFYS